MAKVLLSMPLLLFAATAIASEVPAAGSSTAPPQALQVRQLQHRLQSQRTQTQALRQRVDTLQQQQRDNRERLKRRDQAIKALRRQLQDLAPAPASTPAGQK